MIPSTKQLAANVSNWVETPVVTVAPNSEYRHRYLLFAGPKDPDLLAKHGLDSLLEYGWFGAVAKPLTWILHGFYAICRNYGIAIIMLTVLVRSLMFPLSRRAALNAQKMSELAPEMKRINDLYKDDWEKRTKASQELYKKANSIRWRVVCRSLFSCRSLWAVSRCFSGRAASTAVADTWLGLVQQLGRSRHVVAVEQLDARLHCWQGDWLVWSLFESSSNYHRHLVHCAAKGLDAKGHG